MIDGDDFPFSPPGQINQFVQARLHRFQTDLRVLEPRHTVGKHILTGDCYILDHDQFYTVRAAVSDKYTISPDQVFIVGSAKLGFSIADSKRYRAFCTASDIDVAVVSDSLFDRIWKDVLRFDAEANDWRTEKPMFRKYLMMGWIRPDALPASLPATKDWWQFFQQLTRDVTDGQFKINGGLYRTTEFLQIYQERSVKSCKLALELVR
jgi:hypothetical protein